jgi:predicted lipid-binding transport protein (Tim44 family)
MNDVDRLLARAQVFLAVLFAVGFLGLLTGMIFFHSDMSATVLTTVTTMLTVLGTLLTLQMNFFYARQRPAALPDPTTTTTSTTTTTTPSPGGPDVPISSTVTVGPTVPVAHPAVQLRDPIPRPTDSGS